MPAVLLVARAEARRRLGSLAFLAFLVMVVVAVVLASAAGARRSATSLDRFLRATHTADAVSYAYGTVRPDAARKIGAVPGVDQVATANFYGVDAGTDFDMLVGSSPEGSLFRTIQRPMVLSGRMPAADAPDEVVLSEAAAHALRMHRGDRLDLPTIDPGQWRRYIGGQSEFPGFHGPKLHLSVVGIVRIGSELQGSGKESNPVAIASPAFAAVHGPHIAQETTYFALGLDPSASVPTVGNAIQDLHLAQVGIVQTASSREDWVDTTRSAVDVVAIALAAFAGVAALAGLVAIGQAVTRQVGLDTDIVRTTTALGLTRRDRALAVGLPSMLAVGTGTMLGIVAAAGASPLFPVSLARRAEPRPGIQVDLLVLIGGAVLLLALLSAFTLAIARRRATTGSQPLPRATRRSLIAVGAGRGLVPRLGARLALDRDRSSRRVPTRTAIAGATVGVLGVVGVAVFVGSVQDTLDRPARWGWTWSSSPDAPSTGDHKDLLAQLVAEPDVQALSILFTASAEVDGHMVNFDTFETAKGSIAPPVLEGRLPTGPGEVALGGKVMSGLHTRIGQSVQATTADGRPAPLQVVGRVVLPLLNNSDPGTGAVVTPETLAALDGLKGVDDLLGNHDEIGVFPLLRYPSHADPTRVEPRLAKAYGLTFSAYSKPSPPGRLLNLRTIRPVAVALGLFFALLGLVGLVHALLVSVRRRREEFAVLATFGMLHRQIRRMVLSQSTTIMAVGLVIGIPLGIVAGRLVWEAAVGDLGMIDPASTPASFLIGLGTAALAAAALVSVPPGWMAARRRPAESMRSE